MGGEGYRESVNDDGWSWDVLGFGDDGFGADEQGLVLLPFSFKKFLLIQLRMSSRQVMREVGRMAAVGSEEMYNCL